MKKYIALLLAAVMALSLIACGEEEATETAAAVQQEIETVEVFIISEIKATNSEDTYELEYDENFRIASVKTENKDYGTLEKQLVFDDAGRILSACFRDVGEKIQCTYTVYNYDAYGNRIRENVIYIYDEAGKILSADDTAYFYDEEGRLIKEEGKALFKEYSYDESGRLVRWQDNEDRYCDYVYDENGRKTAMVSGQRDSVSWDNSYTYNDDGMVTKLTAKYSAVETDMVHEFVYKKVKVTKDQVAAMEAERTFLWENITTLFW